MKPLLIIANWKSNKNHLETKHWFSEINNLLKDKELDIKNKKAIVCPSFTNLKTAKEAIEELNLPISIGSQNVSSFADGAYTGEVTARMLSTMVEFCIVGHSERRKYFKETNDDVVEKIRLLLGVNVNPILCISDLSQLEFYIKEEKIQEAAKDIVFVYEPPSAISGGKEYRPESPEIVSSSALKMKEIIGKDAQILYGGSINSENMNSFFNLPEINGGLVGQASLDPLEFAKIIKNA